MQFFHNRKNIADMKKSSLNIGKMVTPMIRAEYKFQIFVKLISGKTITLDVRTSYSIHDVELMIYYKMEREMRESYDLNRLYLTFQGTTLSGCDFDNYKLSDYNIQKGDTIRLQFRLRGGGKRGHVIKTVVKSKTADKTLPSDSNLFASVFNHSEAVNRTTSVSFTHMLKTMPLNDLKSLYEYLMHDRPKKDMKVQKVPEWCKEIKELIEVQKKAHTAIDLMSSPITENIQESFIDSEGEFSMKELIRAVDNRIAVVSDQAMTDI